MKKFSILILKIIFLIIGENFVTVLKQKISYSNSLLILEEGQGEIIVYNSIFCVWTQDENICRTQVYSHVTIATDPDNVRFVFAAVKHTILSGIVDEIFNTGSDYLQ